MTQQHSQHRLLYSLVMHNHSTTCQKAFQLLVTAEQDVRSLEDRVVIAQAAAVALHAKVQEFLNEEAIFVEEVTDTDED